MVYCSEAPPDAATSLSESLSVSLKANYQTAGQTAGGSADFTKGLASYANQLFYRTQGVQLFRDGSFALCLAHMNGFIDNTSFESLIDKLIIASSALIDKEIPYLAEIKGASNPYFNNMSSAKIKPSTQAQTTAAKPELPIQAQTTTAKPVKKPNF
jgi:hypothetical protein